MLSDHSRTPELLQTPSRIPHVVLADIQTPGATLIEGLVRSRR